VYTDRQTNMDRSPDSALSYFVVDPQEELARLFLEFSMEY